MFHKPIRDDIKAGAFLNKRIKHSPFDYKQGECYYLGEPINFAVCYSEHRSMQHGNLAEVSIATGKGFEFSRSLIANALAIYYNNRYTNNIRLQALVPPWNKQALRLLHICGFQLEGRMRNVAKDGDRLLFSLLKNEFEEKHGKYI